MPSHYRNILCATDLSPASRSAVEVAYGLAGQGSTVRLLHVLEPAVLVSPLDGTLLAYGNDPQELIERERQATTQLERLVPERPPGSEIRTVTTVIHDVGVAEQILAAAKTNPVDVIVMGTHGRSGFGRLLMGSVATDVLRRSPVPLIMVHDKSGSRS